MLIKPTASTVKTNFTDSIERLKYKVSTLVNDLYRCKYTTTTTSELDIALNKVTQIYIENGFPRRLIYNKIDQLKKLNFQPSSFRQERENFIKNNPDNNFNLILTYSSRRCESYCEL